MNERRFALLIGNGQYDHPQDLPNLRGPARDLADLKQVLENPALGGFQEVDILLNAPADALRKAIVEFLNDKQRDDLIVLYYTGHGAVDKDDGSLYLSARDTELKLLSATGLEAHFLTREMDKRRLKRVVLVLDCCYSGAFERGAKGGSFPDMDATFNSGYGRVILTATNAIQEALDGERVIEGIPHSLFTHYLIEGLQSGKAGGQGGWISVDEWYAYAYQQVVETPKPWQQTPQKWSKQQEGSPLLIARNPNPLQSQLPESILKGLDPQLPGRVRAAAIEELAQLLQQGEAGLAQAARRKLEELAEDDSRMVSEAARRALGLTPQQTISPVTPAEAKPAQRQPIPNEAYLEESDTVTMTLARGVKMVFVRVPAGEFLMGSDPEKDKDAEAIEQPQHTVHLDDFWIAKFPVTVAQFVSFVKASGHKWLAEREMAKYQGEKARHPVSQVSWNDARAFCVWASSHGSGQKVRLPTEAEWEKAARGTDGRIYPWGDELPDPSQCNFNRLIGDTTPVGEYSPEGDSPYGCADMSGNVWEWTSSLYQSYVHNPEVAREDQGGIDLPVVRGGSFSVGQRHARCAYRLKFTATDRVLDIGFRVVVSLSPLLSEALVKLKEDALQGEYRWFTMK